MAPYRDRQAGAGGVVWARLPDAVVPGRDDGARGHDPAVAGTRALGHEIKLVPPAVFGIDTAAEQIAKIHRGSAGG
jgi:hypothetical protein